MPVSKNFNLNRDYQRGLDAVELEMDVLGHLLVKEAANYLDDNKVNVSGGTKKSLTHEVERFLNGIKLTAGTRKRSAIYLHEGTGPRAKFPPIKPLRRWVKRKLGIAEQAEINRAAFLIARSIKERGTSMSAPGSGKGPRPKPFMDFALARYQDKFQPRLEAAFMRGVNSVN